MNNIQSWMPTYNYKLAYTDFQQGLATNLILKIFLHSAERNEDRDILSLSATCKRFREILCRNSDVVFNAFFSRIPELQDYRFSGKYFDLYKKHKEALKNIQNGNFKTFGPFNLSIASPLQKINNTVILKNKDKNYVWNALNTPLYYNNFITTDRENKSDFHGKFLIKEMNDHVSFFDLAGGQNKNIPLLSSGENGIQDTYKFSLYCRGKMELHLPEAMFPDEKSFLTISSDNQYTHINIWNLESGICEKTIKNIADHNCSQTIKIFCERLPCIIYKGPESKTRYVIHDIEKNKQYEYQVNNALFENSINDLRAFVPYVSDQYIVYYSSNDDLITFVDRESGQKCHKDLGSFKENTDAVKLLRNYQYGYSPYPPYQVKAAYLNEEKGLFLWANAQSINVVSLKNGTEYKHNLKNNAHPFNEKIKLLIENNIVGYSVAKNRIKNSFVILEMNSLELLEEIDTVFWVSSSLSKEHFFFINNTEIYNTKLQKKVTLESSDSNEKHAYGDSKSWKNFLATLNPVMDKNKSSISIFDMDTGKRLVNTSIPFFGTFHWFHGGILAENGESVYFINFNVDHDFPKDFQPL